MNDPGLQFFREASRRKKWLVGVSGGLDSMALLHLLDEAGFRNAIICHLDHGLRGGESAGDARFVRKAAENMGYEVEAVKVDLRRMKEGSGDSLETAGRRARHEFFGGCAKKHRCKRLLLGHHADEQAETVLWNLMRGSHGCRGMRGVCVMEMGGVKMEVSRPLLHARKFELKAWMEGRKYGWREDASNRVNDVVRNRIRNEVLPLLAEIAKRDVAPLLARAAKSDGEAEGLLAWALDRADVLDTQGRLHLGTFNGLPDALQVHAMVEFLKSQSIQDLDAGLIGRCVGLSDTASAAKVNLPGGSWLRRRGGRIFVERA